MIYSTSPDGARVVGDAELSDFSRLWTKLQVDSNVRVTLVRLMLGVFDDVTGLPGWFTDKCWEKKLLKFVTMRDC